MVAVHENGHAASHLNQSQQPRLRAVELFLNLPFPSAGQGEFIDCHESLSAFLDIYLFLDGAGTIIFQKQIVRGLTTAAGIWVTAGIGMAIGAGMYWLGTSAAALTLVGLEVLSYLFKSIGMKSSYVEFSTSRREVVNAVRERLLSDGFIIASYEMEQVNHERATTYQVTMVIRARKAGEQTLFAILHDFQDEMNLYKVQ